MRETSASQPTPALNPTQTRVTTRLGMGLVLYSFAAWLPLPLVPFLPMGTGTRAALGAGLVASAEVAFWGGLLLAGRESVDRVRRFWRRTTSESPEP